MSSRGVKRKGDTNSALLHQLLEAINNIALDDINNPSGDKEFKKNIGFLSQ